MSTIALLTDFGLEDWYVASMKAVLLSINPDAVIVDITHRIPPGDIRAGSFVLSQCFRDFTPGTVFLGVVDPGVGGTRHAIAVAASGYTFVGPDNGLFSFLGSTRDAEPDGPADHRIENPQFLRGVVTATFHGRDIFAPTAAHLSSGATVGEVGPRLPELSIGERAEQGSDSGDEGMGTVIYIDHFGNCITNLRAESLCPTGERPFTSIQINSATVPIVRTFSDVEPGEALAYVGSGGYLEIGIRGGSASVKLHIETGGTVTMAER